MNLIKDKVTEMLDEMLDGDDFNRATSEQIKEVGKSVLDPRAVPSTLWYTEDLLVVKSGYDLKMINYYGGFEYVDKESTYTVGDYTFFSGDDNRVNSVLNSLNEVEREEEDT